MSILGDIENEIVSRLTGVLTLPNQEYPKVDVQAWPASPKDFKMIHPFGCVLVVYKDSKFKAGSTGGHFVDTDAEFEVSVIARTLREPNAPELPEPIGVGMYDLLESCKTALLGWQPVDASAAMQIHGERFSDYTEGGWTYTQLWRVPMVTVADRRCPTGPWRPDACCTDANLTTQVIYEEQP